MKFGLSGALFEAAYQHFLAGRLAEAELACRQALQADPRQADSLHLLGVIAGQTGHAQDSLALFDQAIAVVPGFAEAHCNRGVALMSLGQARAAEQAFRRSLELKPRQVEAWFGLGNLKAFENAPDAAAEAFRQALAVQPDNAQAWTNLAIALQRQGRLDEAVAAYERARAILPGAALIHYNLAIALLALGLADEAAASSRRAVELDPRYVQAHSNVLVCMTYQAAGSAADLLAAHRVWDQAHGLPLKPPSAAYPNSRDPERPLKVGYVSGDFQTHPVGWLLANVLPAHDRSQIDVYCYSNNPFTDAVTERLKDGAHQWRDIWGLSDEAVAALVRQDQIDILVDLSGHTDKNRLLTFARKPAPVQVSWLGYPGTTGLSAIDYLIMDAATAPDGADSECSESLIRLPHGRFCYAPPSDAPGVAARPDAPVVFGSFNNLAKVGPEVVRLWARVLTAAPRSRLVLKWKALSEASARSRLLEAFAAEGVAADRLELRGASPHPDMLAQYGDIDIALDPFPYGGGITSAEALWMGVPVVTLPQDRIASRQTLAFLTELDLTDLAAASADDYVRIAAGLAADPARRARLRQSLRQAMAASPLTDGAKFTPGLEDAYRRTWRRWCSGEAPAAIDVA